MLFSAYNYLTKHDVMAGFFDYFNYPTYLVYPLAISKLLGLIAIWGNFSKLLRGLAYAGFFFNTLLAFFAHYINDGTGVLFSFVAFCCVLTSYFAGKLVRS